MSHTLKIIGLCDQCRHKHPIEFDPLIGYGNACRDWALKHSGHEGVRFLQPGRSRARTARLLRRLLKQVAIQGFARPEFVRDPLSNLYIPNADVKLAFATEAALTITLTGLATSSTLVAGREATAVDNTTNKYLDYHLAGKVTTGTTPTDLKTIQVWGYGQVEDTPEYPDVFDGTDSAETVTSSDIRNAGLNFICDTGTNNTSDRTYWFKPCSIAAAFGGVVPPRWGIFVVHDTGVNLNATATNHRFNHQGYYATVT